MDGNLAEAILRENVLLIQEIHRVVHQLEAARTTNMYAHRDRWTADEDQLLQSAVLIYGAQHAIISELIVTKTKMQVYFRLRYLKERSQKKAKTMLENINM
ncbi:SANT/Myb_domain [Hexamita inflata]|uniref:SANT/Myb domain n=1 Tax=Hexamita inflata TaxID=28002 RepID=A0AA86TIL9_9EUKA|nr:SANT/Myb domain [Hexamita inflata]CAI9917058.1 SANT/Myb domain [Hexamita inflata]CAI9931479.1 SANT/Myb domain [Hexamita inflata]